MKTSSRRRCFPGRCVGVYVTVVSLGLSLAGMALAGPDTTPAARRSRAGRPVAAMCRQVADSLLATCGLDAFVPKAVPAGYLQTTGPEPMRVRPRMVAPPPRRVPHSAPDIGTPAAPATPAAGPPPAVDPAATNEAAAPTPPVAPAATPADSALLPGTGPATGRDRTEEILSYFHRPASPAGSDPRAADHGADDPAGGPSFLQAPPPVSEPVPLPPSRAIYRVAP